MLLHSEHQWWIEDHLQALVLSEGLPAPAISNLRPRLGPQRCAVDPPDRVVTCGSSVRETALCSQHQRRH